MKSKTILGLLSLGLFVFINPAYMNTAIAAVVTGNIYGSALGSTVDHWAFTVNTTGSVTIDALSWEREEATKNGIDVNGDGELAFFDTYMYLFTDDGVLDAADMIAYNDDSTNTYADGSISSVDSYMSMVLSPGDYIIAIGAFSLDIGNAIDGFNDGNNFPARCNGEIGAQCFFELYHDHGDYQLTMTGDITEPTLSAVPVPAAVWLFGSGLIGLTGVMKRKVRT
jgi:hypothetical protein